MFINFSTEIYDPNKERHILHMTHTATDIESRTIDKKTKTKKNTLLKSDCIEEGAVKGHAGAVHKYALMIANLSYK